MTEYGYARASTSNHLLEIQRDAMHGAGITNIFEDEGVFSSKVNAPGLDAALKQLRAGDTLVVWRLDRLGKATAATLGLIKELQDRRVGFHSLTEALDTRGVHGEFLAIFVAAFSQMERDVVLERTSRGLEAARARGKVGGRKPSLAPDMKVTVMKMYRSKQFTIKEIARHYSVSEPTIYRTLSEMKAREE